MKIITKNEVLSKLWYLMFFFISCSPKTSVIYQEKTVTKSDTITVVSRVTDTIPCDDFEFSIEDKQKDTVYIKVVDKQISVKYIKKTDTIFKQPIIITPQPKKVDNSVHIKAKNGSAIGDGNKITTKKNNWWWIFLAGALSWFIIQNIGFRILKSYFPFLKFLP